MVESDINLYYNAYDTKIEDVIEVRKRNGDYDVRTYINNTVSCRYAYSAPLASIGRWHFDITNICKSERELNKHLFDTNCFNIGPTDSEVTVVRVKREGLQFKQCQNNWNMHDDAIPGDGTHLGDSPSLVNLVTLVAGYSEQSLIASSVCETNEYLVPLSSWDPCDNPHQFQDIQSTIEADSPTVKPILHQDYTPCNYSQQSKLNVNIESKITADGTAVQNSKESKTELQVIKHPNKQTGPVSNLAGRISKFLRNRVFRKKTDTSNF